MILIADSGSTKTDWAVGADTVVRTQGLNPYHQSRETIQTVLRDELLPQLTNGGSEVERVMFYGSGVRPEVEAVMEGLLREAFPQAEQVEAHSDLLGAARALCGHDEGIACILGTGANSCYYDGERIVKNTPALGYILGDEGSGAALGKRLIHALYKGCLSDGIVRNFESETGLTLPVIIDRVYRQPMANRFLASLSEYVHRHLDWAGMQWLVEENFVDFFSENISLYERDDLPVSFVGSIAYYYQEQLRKAAERQNFKVGTVLRTPLEGLVRYGM